MSSPEVGAKSRDARRHGRIASLLLGVTALYAIVVSLGAFVAQVPPDSPLISFSAEARGPVYEVGVTHGLVGVVLLFLFFRVRRRGAAPFLPKALMVLLPFLYLLSADRVLNVFWPPPLPREGIYQPHPRRGWTHLPGSHVSEWGNVFIDFHGLRVPARKWERRLGDGRRMLFVGDSVTFAYLLPAEAGFVEVAGKLLTRCPRTADIITLNGGTTAYAPDQEWDWLKNEGAALNPDFVVVQVSLNDVTSGFHAAAGWDATLHPEFNQMKRDPHWSAFMRLAFEWGRTQAYGENLSAAAEEIEELHIDELYEPEESDRVRRAWERAEKSWRKMAEFCKSRKVPMTFMLVPVEGQVLDPRSSSLPQKRFGKFADGLGVPCLDLLPILRDRRRNWGSDAPSAFVDQFHLSEAGCEVAAGAIVALFRERGLIERCEDDPAPSESVGLAGSTEP